MDGEIDWQFRAEHAEKACAEMRRAIEDVINFKCDDYYHDFCSCSSTRREHLQRALSSDCGSDYVRREELEAAKSVQRLQKAFDDQCNASRMDAAEIEKMRRELDAAKAENARLREALENLVDQQNGPPLLTYKEAWQKAMNKAEQALAGKEGK